MQPLAERLRPKNLDEYIGQKHLVGKGAIIRNMIETGRIQSIILWGPPGVGKTTLAKIIAKSSSRQMFSLSAISSGVKEVREVLDSAKRQTLFSNPSPILFIDEIHRFNKSQQDSLLGAVEQGIITLIGATTENPSFEVNSPLLSRCEVYVLKPLEKADLEELLNRALTEDVVLKEKNIKIEETTALFRQSGGDARKFLNVLETVINAETSDEIVINDEIVSKRLQKNTSIYDKKGEMHYDIISAFIKSIRGSDANAAIYYLARMLNGGEDLKFIARRLVISASEDIGLANPNAMLLANACFQAVNTVGYPESRIMLAECVIYMANSPKSNSAYQAINSAMDFAQKTGDLAIPLHLRNAPTKLMEQLGYAKEYKYAHDYEGNFVKQEFLPEEISGTTFYIPQENPAEQKAKDTIKRLWENKYKTE
ncbi:MAG: replication-associated recombination protein A [Bacteroidales bacterium]|nr:replication-associated recombination protein A [Bacteroidales bacterium]